nr:MAG TPA: hypothetical protein [Crassvirales sp.]
MLYAGRGYFFYSSNHLFTEGRIGLNIPTEFTVPDRAASATFKSSSPAALKKFLAAF